MGAQILGADGQPMRRSPGRALSQGMGSTPYMAADPISAELAGWDPWLASPDAETNAWRGKIVARIRDIVRNDGWASGAVTRIVDSAIGADFRPSPNPDFRSLQWWTSAFDAQWAAEFSAWAKGCWRDWAEDPGRWCDLPRMHSIAENFQLAFREQIVTGEACGVISWRPERRAYGRGVYATTLGLVDTDRLGNPNNGMDTERMRGGVEIDADGAAVAYHFRRSHPGEFFPSGDQVKWDRWVRETSWGRPVVIHWIDAQRIGQHRGVGVLAPVLARLKMLTRYDATELQAAIINAVFAAYIESPHDPDLVQESLSDTGGLPALQQARSDFHSDKRLALNGSRIPILFPGEKITTVAANRPSGNYGEFQGAVLRHIAAATGQSEAQVSQDWSRTNYSSARAALLETWKTMERRRKGFSRGFAQQVYVAFLEEAMERDAPPLPAGAPDFVEARAAYTRCAWHGPGRGWVDPVKEPAGAQLRMESALSTLQREAAENVGMDYEDLLDQRAIEVAAFKARGLPLPAWTGALAAAALTQREEQPAE